MSEYQHHVGTLTKVEIPQGQTTEEYVKNILDENEIQMESYYSDIFECLMDELNDEYYYHRKSSILYKVNNEEIDPYDDIIKSRRLDENNIMYELKFCDGVSYYRECLDNALDKLDDEEKN